MKITQKVKKLLRNYAYTSPAVQLNLARLLMHGKLGGSGKLIIYPIDQGFEHGPGRSFSMNIAAYDPLYHFKVAADAGLSGLAAPLGFLQTGALPYMGRIPLILKMNSGNSLAPNGSKTDQAITSTINDAVQLGCIGIGFTIYPGVDSTYDMYEELADLSAQAQERGLFVLVWSYPRGSMEKEDETALDTVAYGAHMACLLGAHIIKVKLPTAHINPKIAPKIYTSIPANTLTDRVKHVVDSCFNGQRIVIFSGGQKQTVNTLYQDAKSICKGGGQGSIIGRNCFQRPYNESLEMLQKLIEIYRKNT